jgi:hypothetical protein
MKHINFSPPKKLLEAFIDVNHSNNNLADLMQMSSQNIEGVGNNNSLASGTMIQPPVHVTIPAVASWFT